MGHLGYNDVSILQSRIAISKLWLDQERFTDGTGIFDSIISNRNKEDIGISRIVITRVDCTLNSDPRSVWKSGILSMNGKKKKENR